MRILFLALFLCVSTGYAQYSGPYPVNQPNPPPYNGGGQNVVITTPVGTNSYATNSIGLTALSTNGATSGQVVGYNGTTVTWVTGGSGGSTAWSAITGLGTGVEAAGTHTVNSTNGFITLNSSNYAVIGDSNGGTSSANSGKPALYVNVGNTSNTYGNAIVFGTDNSGTNGGSYIEGDQGSNLYLRSGYSGVSVFNDDIIDIRTGGGCDINMYDNNVITLNGARIVVGNNPTDDGSNNFQAHGTAEVYGVETVSASGANPILKVSDNSGANGAYISLQVNGTEQGKLTSDIYGDVSLTGGGSSSLYSVHSLSSIGINYYGRATVGPTSSGDDGTNTLQVYGPEKVYGALSVTGSITGNVVSPVTAQTSSYTLALTDEGTTIELNSNSAIVLTVPANATVAFPIGTQINVIQYGTGAASVAAASGVTLRYLSTLNFVGQYGYVTVQKIGTNEWVVTGALQ